jgi:hypothetical protein
MRGVIPALMVPPKEYPIFCVIVVENSLSFNDKVGSPINRVGNIGLS